MSNKIPHCLLASVRVSYDIGFADGFHTRFFFRERDSIYSVKTCPRLILFALAV